MKPPPKPPMVSPPDPWEDLAFLLGTLFACVVIAVCILLGGRPVLA